MPRARFVTDVAVDTGRFKSKTLMKPNARRVRKGNPSVGFEKALDSQKFEQSGAQCRPNPLAAVLFRYVDSDVDRPPVGSPFVMPARVSVTQNLVQVLADQPWIALRNRSHAPFDLRNRGASNFKRYRRGFADRTVNLEDGPRISFRRQPDFPCHQIDPILRLDKVICAENAPRHT